MSTLPLVIELSPAPDFAAALAAFASWRWPIAFDSARRGGPLGRYSFLSADPLRTVQLGGAESGCDPFVELRRWQAACSGPLIPQRPPFQGGIAGLLGYELGGCWERLPMPPRDDLQMPVLAAGLYDWVLAWDHEQDRSWLICQGWTRENLAASAASARDRAQSIRAALAAATTSLESRNRSADPGQPSAPNIAESISYRSNFTHAEYLAAVERVIEYIRAGDIFQANLSQRFRADTREDPLAIYLRLRDRNPAPFAGYFAADDWAVLSASPEQFLQLRDGAVTTRPIKGTRRRLPPAEADLYLQDDLQFSSKDVAENTMIVDLLRNDLSRVCQPGSIRVPVLCQVESYATVHHLVSEVRGRLLAERNVWDLFAAAFPGGSITGCPKVRAMEIIAELEQVTRGPYCGSLFYVSPDGSADSNILIRTIVQKAGQLHFSAGGGIVAQSMPADEYAETLHKAAGLFRALNIDTFSEGSG